MTRAVSGRGEDAGVMSSADEVSRTLRGTVLEDLPVRHGDNGVLIIEGIHPARVLECWRAARQVLSLTGRWPVAIAPEWASDFPEVSGDQLAELEAEVRGMEDSRVFSRWVNDLPTAQEDWHHYLESHFPGAGLPAAMAAELPEPVLDDDVDRWVHERLTSDPSLVPSAEQLQSHISRQDWFQPDSVDLALLPTSSPWLAGAWLHYFGAESDPNALVAALQRWNTSWDAELVASWGTMLQFTVGRRPQQGEEAWELAGQLLAWGGSVQMSQWQLALVLARIDTWFLHDRP